MWDFTAEMYVYAYIFVALMWRSARTKRHSHPLYSEPQATLSKNLVDWRLQSSHQTSGVESYDYQITEREN